MSNNLSVKVDNIGATLMIGDVAVARVFPAEQNRVLSFVATRKSPTAASTRKPRKAAPKRGSASGRNRIEGMTLDVLRVVVGSDFPLTHSQVEKAIASTQVTPTPFLSQTVYHKLRTLTAKSLVVTAKGGVGVNGQNVAVFAATDAGREAGRIAP